MLIQTIYGIFGSIGPEAENLLHMRRIADHLFGDQSHGSILGAGRHQMGLITMGAIMGGHCRVGLEDSIYLKKGQLAKSNVEQVTKIRTILEIGGFATAAARASSHWSDAPRRSALAAPGRQTGVRR